MRSVSSSTSGAMLIMAVTARISSSLPTEKETNLVCKLCFLCSAALFCRGAAGRGCVTGEMPRERCPAPSLTGDA